MMKKPLKVAAYSFLIVSVVSFILGLFGSFNGFVPIVNFDFLGYFFVLVNIVLFILILYVFYGFILLGRKCNNRLLVVISYVGIVLSAVYLLYLLFGSFVIDVPDMPLPGEDADFSHLGIFILKVHLVYSLVVGVLSILHGIALLKVGKKINYSKPAGVLNIVAGATMIIFVGYMVMIAAIILEILLLFEASKKFESKLRSKKR